MEEAQVLAGRGLFYVVRICDPYRVEQNQETQARPGALGSRRCGEKLGAAVVGRQLVSTAVPCREIRWEGEERSSSRRFFITTMVVLVLAAGGCGGAGAGDAETTTIPATTTTATTTVPATSTTTVLVGGDRIIVVDGGSRRYELSIPASIDPAIPAPLVMNLHGMGGPALGQRMLNFNDTAEEEGIVVVYPSAVGGAWDLDTSADIEFISAIIEEVSALIAIDPDRVYSIGASQGGALSTLLACRLPDRVTAVASVAVLVHHDLPACPTPSPAGLSPS